MAVLDDPEARDRIIEMVSNGATADAAGKELGISRATIRRYARGHHDFGERLAAARDRRGRMRDMLNRGQSPPDVHPTRVVLEPVVMRQPLQQLADDAGTIDGLPSVETFCTWMWATAQDPEHRASSQCARMLGEVLVGPVARAQQRREEQGKQPVREADALAAVTELLSRKKSGPDT